MALRIEKGIEAVPDPARVGDSSANDTSTAFALNTTFTNKWETHVNVTVASGLTADRIYTARTNGSNKPMIINASM